MAHALIEGVTADDLLADKGYDSRDFDDAGVQRSLVARRGSEREYDRSRPRPGG